MADCIEVKINVSRKRSLSPSGSEPREKKEKNSSSTDLKKKKGTGFSNEIFSETSYVFDNGLRYVKPYYFTFESFAKGRWIGRTVFDVFSKEFQSEKPSYYKKAIEAGKITVGGKVAGMDTLVERNKLVSHRIHRHEPPVIHQPLEIVHQDDQVVIIDKPPSIPVHPCGRYRHNTVVFILAKEHNIKNLHTIHRLDRLTSGVLMFAKSLYKAQKLEEEIRKKTVSKIYLARVVGRFPDEVIECNEPIIVVSHKLGVCHVDPKGKPCSTSFKLLHYDGQTSLIRCIPKTGRMHQIRVHLQWLGYPILNDPLYNHPAWGPDRGRKGNGIDSMDKVLSRIVQSRFIDDIGNHPSSNDDHSTESSSELASITHNEGVNEGASPRPSYHHNNTVDPMMKCAYSRNETNIYSTSDGEGIAVSTDTSITDSTSSNEPPTSTSSDSGTAHTNSTQCYSGSSLVFPKDPDCTECWLDRAVPSPNELMMCLHALKYSGEGWEYETKSPPWAAATGDQ